MIILRIILLGWILQGVPSPPQSMVSGIVVKAGSLEPLQGVQVKLENLDVPSKPPVTTSADGNFEFRNVEPGQYRLLYSRPGYVSTDIPQAITIRDGRKIENIQGILQPGGSIAGRFLDKNGEPLINAQIQAMQYSYAQGRRTLIEVQTTRTNDVGEYRLFWLTPGAYVISARPEDPGMPSNVRFPSPGDLISVSSTGVSVHAPQTVNRRVESDGTVVDEIAIPVYYPGTPDPKSAMSISVRSGETIAGINLTAARSRVYRVRGKVIEGATGKPVAAQLAAATPESDKSFGPPRDISSDGTFTMTGLLPGAYFIVAAAGTLQSRIAGRMPVTIGNRDLENVTVTLWPDFRITGKVIIEGDIPKSETTSPQPRVGIAIQSDLTDSSGSLFFDRTATASPGGDFSLGAVFPGDYQVVVNPALPQNLVGYVKAIRFGSVDAIREKLHLDAATNDTLEVVLSLNPASVTGDVVNLRQIPVPNATVAVIPNDRRRTIEFKSVKSDASGHFVLNGLAPGDYKIFAWESIEANAWRDPEFLAADEARSIALRLSEGIRENVSRILVITPRDTP